MDHICLAFTQLLQFGHESGVKFDEPKGRRFSYFLQFLSKECALVSTIKNRAG